MVKFGVVLEFKGAFLMASGKFANSPGNFVCKMILQLEFQEEGVQISKRNCWKLELFGTTINQRDVSHTTTEISTDAILLTSDVRLFPKSIFFSVLFLTDVILSITIGLFLVCLFISVQFCVGTVNFTFKM